MLFVVFVSEAGQGERTPIIDLQCDATKLCVALGILGVLAPPVVLGACQAPARLTAIK